jgi:rRNA maturation protein Rpf1
MEYLRGRIDGQKIKSHEGQFLVIGKENTKPSWLGFYDTAPDGCGSYANGKQPSVSDRRLRPSMKRGSSLK